MLREDLEKFRPEYPRADEDIRDVLAGHAEGNPIRPMLSFIVLMGGSGYEYCLRKLGFDAGRLQLVHQLDAGRYAEELQKSSPGVLKVAVVDVLHCLEILEQLAGKGLLVFPLDAAPARRLPEYNLGIAVNLRSTEWVEFFEYAFGRILREDREQIAKRLVTLHRELVEFLKDAFERLAACYSGEGSPLPGEKSGRNALARSMAQRFLSLTGNPPEDVAGWRPILEDAGKPLGLGA